MSRHLLAALLILAAACSKERPAPKHVLFIVIDTQRADHLSGYGYSRPTSPVLDALAKEGVLFRRAVSQSSWTLPSMISMYSGRYISEEVMKPPADVPWLPEIFQKAGWATGGFVTNDLMSADQGYGRGFDAYTWPLPEHGSNEPILKWIRDNAGRKTFTLVHLLEPHDPYDPPADLIRWTREKSIPAERSRFYDQISAELSLVDREKSQAEIERLLGAYDDEVRAGDRRIGEIFDAYKAAGLWDETLVFVTADHGEGLFTRVQFPTGTRAKAMREGQPPTLLNTLLMTHGSHVDLELLHVPLILKAPGLEPAMFDPWVENVDVAPTLLELCGIPPPPGAQGRSLVPFAEDPEERDGLNEGVIAYTRYNTSVITQDSIQVILPSPRGECDFDLAPRVYDLARDPECRTDLSASRRDSILHATALAKAALSKGVRAQAGPIDPKQLDRMRSLGYVNSDVIDSVRHDFEAMPVEDLLERIVDPADCFVRLEAARALEPRDLDAAQREKLRDISAKEVSAAVKAQIERVLAR